MLIPHNDPLVISMNIMGTKVHRLLVDTGSYANIIFRSTLSKLGNYDSYLQPCNHMILGLGDVVSIPYGIIRLAVELVSTKDSERRLTRMLDFLVVEMASTYNGFLGRPFIHEFQEAVSTYYYCVKFPTPTGTGTLQGDQKKARECLLSLSPAVQPRVSVLEWDLTELGGLRETEPAGDQAHGEEHGAAASGDDQEMLDVNVQEAGTSQTVNQQVEVNDPVQTSSADLEPRIGFEPMEVEDELDPTEPIIDPRWK
ncbi:hypothetical protein ACS0TY_014054 [Phlomoides rotata]